MTQCQFCGCQKVAYQWFGGTFIFTCGTWSGSTSIRGDRCYENEIAALKADRDTLANGVLAAREGMEKGWIDEAVMDAFHAALKLAKEDKQ
jgi:hypothetical protein